MKTKSAILSSQLEWMGHPDGKHVILLFKKSVNSPNSDRVYPGIKRFISSEAPEHYELVKMMEKQHYIMIKRWNRFVDQYGEPNGNTLDLGFFNRITWGS